MDRICKIATISLLGVLLSFTSCAKEEVAEISYEKMPITTSSAEAAAEFQKGMAFTNRVQRETAREHFSLAVEKDPEFALAWLNLAYVSPGAGLVFSGLDSAKKYASKVSEAEQLIIQAAELGFEGNNIEQVKILQKLVEKYPGDEQAHLLLGNYYFGAQQYRLAINSYTAAAEINKNLAILHNQLGYSQRALGNYGEAEKAFKFSIKLNSDNPNAFDSYAELLMEMGRYKESIEFYAKALERDPYFSASYIGIACNYGFLGEQDKARTQIDLLKDIAPNHVVMRQAHYSEALTYACEGDLSRSIETIKTSYKLAEEQNDSGNMAGDLVGLGNLYLEMDAPEKALENFNRSIQIINESSYPPAVIENAYTTHLYNIARVFGAQGDFKRAAEAADSFEQKVMERQNPVQIKLIYQLKGILALQQNEFAKAIAELEQANQLNPYNLYRIGQAYAGLGQADEAASFTLRAEELNVLNSMDQAIVLSKTRFKSTNA